MRRRITRLSDVDADGIPVELLVGPCIEVWSPAHDPIEAWHRFRLARIRFLDGVGAGRWDRASLPPCLRSRPPWSFTYMAEHRPGVLAEMLVRFGLPPDWLPEPAFTEG